MVTAVVTPVPPSKSKVSVSRAIPSLPLSPVILRVPATVAAETAVTKPFAFTVIIGIEEADPTCPTLPFTVARVVTKLTAKENLKNKLE